MRLRQRLEWSWPRLTAAASVMGTLVWLLWPEKGWRPDAEPTVALLGAVGSWLYVELVRREPADVRHEPLQPRAPALPHPHDVSLLRRFHGALPLEDRVYLRDHDFRQPTKAKHLDGLEVIADGWRGADFSFHDEAVQTALIGLQRHARALLDLTGTYLFMSDRNPENLSPLTDMDRQNGVSERTYGHVREMNGQRRRTLEALDHFVTFSRDRLAR